MDRTFYKEAFFGGMTANAFKLGTVLSLGWFWFRPSGCRLLYRRLSTETIDFSNILTAGALDAAEITPPAFLGHNSNTDYFYVVRRANCCGDLEQTLGAVVKVTFDDNGDLAQAGPNSIFAVCAEQIPQYRVKLIWYYCPLEQKSTPCVFDIFHSPASEQIDYNNLLASVEYRGRRFYSYESDSLSVGEHLFSIKAEDANGISDFSFACLRISLNTQTPQSIDILSAQPI